MNIKLTNDEFDEIKVYPYYILTILECDVSKCDCDNPINDIIYDKEEAINDFNSVVTNGECWFCGGLKIQLIEKINGVEKTILYYDNKK